MRGTGRLHRLLRTRSHSASAFHVVAVEVPAAGALNPGHLLAMSWPGPNVSVWDRADFEPDRCIVSCSDTAVAANT